MSEPRSAFAAYKASNSSKKTAAKKTSTNGAASCPYQKPTAAASTSKGKAAAGKNAKANETKAPKKSTTTTANKTAPKSKTTTTAAAKNSNKNAVAGKAAATAAKANKLGAHNLDDWVEELYNAKKKLTKEQEKRKKELDAYMAKQLNTTPSSLDEEENEGEDYDSSEDSDFNGEYTMNSYYEDDDDDAGSENGEAEEWSDISGEEEETVTDASEEETDNNAASAAQIKSSSSQATKRKNNEDANNNNNNNNKSKNAQEISKKSKQETTEQNTSTLKRRSLAATTANDNSASSNNNKSKARRTIDSNGSSSSNAKSTVVTSIKSEPLSPPANIIKQNSIVEGKRMLGWLLDPVKPDDFFKTNWEKSACFIKRSCAEFYQSLISFKAIDEMLINNYIEFTTHIDITSYKNGVRETLNPEGRAMPPTVWSHYGDGCSIRLLNPHAYMPALYKLNVILQEYFHCLVGANAYLTPPNSQGFAPHYDDIEAFVLQIEGRKRWKLYTPLQKSDELPRDSSHNFKPDEIGKPIFEKVLLPGDLLYFPRGTIHQACTEPGHHSLHITLSVYQKQAYADLYEKLLPLMLQRAIKSHIDLRRGLPLNTFQNLGVAYSDTESEERAKLQKHIKMLFTKQMTPSEDLIDAAVDQLAKKYQHEALPPEIHFTERARTVYGSRTTTDAKGECQCDYELTLETNVRLLRANILRLVREADGKINVYYHVDNAKEYCKYDPFYMEIEASEAGTIEMLMRSYPAYVGISQFPLKKNDRKLDVATALWERGLLMTEKPFK